MKGVVEIQLWQFGLIYLLLLIVVGVMKKCHAVLQSSLGLAGCVLF